MTENPSVWGRMFARMQGEVATTALEAYRRASLPVFELMDRVEARRQACAMDGLTPWTIPPATRAEFLCAWNAFVLQTLGNDILDADYADYPATAGFVPPVTADQVLAFFAQVEGWVDRAQQAAASPEYVLDVRVPAQLPAWSDVEPCPPSHLRGLLKAMRSVGEHAAAAMAFLPESVPDAGQQTQLHRIRQLHASAQSKARYAADLHGVDPPPEVHDRTEPYAREAIEMFYRLGQLIADPALADSHGAPRTPALPAPSRGKEVVTQLLASRGLDEWCLTDASAAERMRSSPSATKVIRQMWAKDPDPERTLAILAEIEAARKAGVVAYATSWGVRLGQWRKRPWGPIYVAKRQVELAGVQLRQEQQFVYEVRAGTTAKEFRRRIVPI